MYIPLDSIKEMKLPSVEAIAKADAMDVALVIVANAAQSKIYMHSFQTSQLDLRLVH